MPLLQQCDQVMTLVYTITIVAAINMELKARRARQRVAMTLAQETLEVSIWRAALTGDQAPGPQTRWWPAPDGLTLNGESPVQIIDSETLQGGGVCETKLGENPQSA